MIKIKIDCTKIEKKRLFAGKNGAQYLDAVLIETPDSKFDQDYMIVQDVTKEEREAGTRGAILGNAKIMGNGKVAATKQASVDKQAGDEDDVPF